MDREFMNRTANELIMDLSKWSDLSDSLKEIIINVCHSVYLESLSEYLSKLLSLYELEENTKLKLIISQKIFLKKCLKYQGRLKVLLI